MLHYLKDTLTHTTRHTLLHSTSGFLLAIYVTDLVSMQKYICTRGHGKLCFSPIELIQYALKLSSKVQQVDILFTGITLTPFTFGAFSQTGRHESKEEERYFTQIK